MSAEYSNLEETKNKKRSRLDTFLNRLPYYFSYVILISTWMLFMLFITLGEVLLKRKEIGRFLEQTIIYNSLLFLTLISLVTTSNRSPGIPDQSLAPPIPHPEIQDIPIEPENNEGEDDDDNVPLRYLRNAQWVNTRIGKDRPSPLPVPSNRKYPPSPPARSRPSDQSNTIEEEEYLSESEYSPFPLSAKSPFVPTSAVDAGEDDQDILDDLVSTAEAEGSDSEQLEAQASTTLLRSNQRTDRIIDGRSKSLMAKSNNGEVRWCKKCKGWKPDRCHHCRHCEKCVLKMDHHCPWVGTCVGYHNYKPFFLFINYALLISIYVTFEAGYESYRFFQDPSGAVPYRPIQMDGSQNNTDTASIAASDEWSDGLGISPAIFMMLAVMGGFMTLAMGGLVGFHWYLMLNNQTTLENITHAYPSALLDEVPKDAQWKADHLLTRSERNRLKWEAREINVYDLGWRKNMTDLFLGEKKKITYFGAFQALWPTGRPNRYDRRSGHFFDFNPRNFEKLRDLTLELRYGIKSNSEGKGRESFDESSDHEYDEDDEGDTAEEGYELDTITEQSSDKSDRAGKVRWFEV